LCDRSLVSDLIDGFVCMMKAKAVFTGPINRGNPTEFSMCRPAENVLKLTGSQSNLSFKPLLQDDPKQCQPDIVLAKEKLGWETTVRLEDGLKKAINYFKRLLNA